MAYTIKEIRTWIQRNMGDPDEEFDELNEDQWGQLMDWVKQGNDMWGGFYTLKKGQQLTLAPDPEPGPEVPPVSRFTAQTQIDFIEKNDPETWEALSQMKSGFKSQYNRDATADEQLGWLELMKARMKGTQPAATQRPWDMASNLLPEGFERYVEGGRYNRETNMWEWGSEVVTPGPHDPTFIEPVPPEDEGQPPITPIVPTPVEPVPISPTPPYLPGPGVKPGPQPVPVQTPEHISRAFGPDFATNQWLNKFLEEQGRYPYEMEVRQRMFGTIWKGKEGTPEYKDAARFASTTGYWPTPYEIGKPWPVIEGVETGPRDVAPAPPAIPAPPGYQWMMDPTTMQWGLQQRTAGMMGPKGPVLPPYDPPAPVLPPYDPPAPVLPPYDPPAPVPEHQMGLRIDETPPMPPSVPDWFREKYGWEPQAGVGEQPAPPPPGGQVGPGVPVQPPGGQVSGRVAMVGNEPFTRLVLKTADGRMIPLGPEYADMQDQQVTIPMPGAGQVGPGVGEQLGPPPPPGGAGVGEERMPQYLLPEGPEMWGGQVGPGAPPPGQAAINPATGQPYPPDIPPAPYPGGQVGPGVPEPLPGPQPPKIGMPSPEAWKEGPYQVNGIWYDRYGMPMTPQPAPGEQPAPPPPGGQGEEPRFKVGQPQRITFTTPEARQKVIAELQRLGANFVIPKEYGADYIVVTPSTEMDRNMIGELIQQTPDSTFGFDTPPPGYTPTTRGQAGYEEGSGGAGVTPPAEDYIGQRALEFYFYTPQGTWEYRPDLALVQAFPMLKESANKEFRDWALKQIETTGRMPSEDELRVRAADYWGNPANANLPDAEQAKRYAAITGHFPLPSETKQRIPITPGAPSITQPIGGQMPAAGVSDLSKTFEGLPPGVIPWVQYALSKGGATEGVPEDLQGWVKYGLGRAAMTSTEQRPPEYVPWGMPPPPEWGLGAGAQPTQPIPPGPGQVGGIGTTQPPPSTVSHLQQMPPPPYDPVTGQPPPPA